MLYGTDEDDVIGQYVEFTKIQDEQQRIYGRTPEAIKNTIRICKDRNILKDYLEKREKEVISMYSFLFDEEIISRNHDAQLTREVTQQVTQKMTQNTEDVISELLADGSITPEKADEIRKRVSAGV